LLFTNDEDNSDRAQVEVFNTCTGEAEGAICFAGQTSNWGLHIDSRTDTIYATSAFGTRAIYKATVADINSGDCTGSPVQPFLSTGPSNVPNIGDSYLPGNNIGNIQGITTDEFGNIYVVMGQPFRVQRDTPSQLYKYSSSGVLLARSVIDDDLGDGTNGKFSFAIGITYSETSQRLYVSTATSSADEDCIAIFDTDPDGDSVIEYLGTGFPNPPSGTGTTLPSIPPSVWHRSMILFSYKN